MEWEVEAGPRYTPSFNVYTVEADDEEEARESALDCAAEDWAHFSPEFVVTSVRPSGDS